MIGCMVMELGKNILGAIFFSTFCISYNRELFTQIHSKVSNTEWSFSRERGDCSRAIPLLEKCISLENNIERAYPLLSDCLFRQKSSKNAKNPDKTGPLSGSHDHTVKKSAQAVSKIAKNVPKVPKIEDSLTETVLDSHETYSPITDDNK